MLQNDPTVREKLFTMRMSAEEADRLEAVAKHYASNGAGVIRMLVKREHDTIMARGKMGDDEAFGLAVAAYQKHCERTGETFYKASPSASGFKGSLYVLRTARPAANIAWVSLAGGQARWVHPSDVDD